MDDITRSNWRDHLKVHPAADLFPLLLETDPATLKELAEDIRQHGQREPASYIKDSGGKRVLLDGRNRLDAIEMLGRKIDINDSCMFEQLSSSIDAQAFIISKNIHRRHLSAEDKRELIGKLLKAQPQKSDRQIAKEINASPTTVGKIRAEKEATGDVSKVDTRTDTKGRKQPATKKPPHKPEPNVDLEAERAEAAKRIRQLMGKADPEPPIEKVQVEDNWAGNDPGDDEETCWRRGLIYRAAEFAGHAAYEDWSQFKVDPEAVAAATRAAEAWKQTAAYLQSIQNKQEAERADNGLTIPDYLKRAAP